MLVPWIVKAKATFFFFFTKLHSTKASQLMFGTQTQSQWLSLCLVKSCKNNFFLWYRCRSVLVNWDVWIFSPLWPSRRFFSGGVTGLFMSQRVLMSVSPLALAPFSYACIPGLAQVPACTLHTINIVLNHYMSISIPDHLFLLHPFYLFSYTCYSWDTSDLDPFGSLSLPNPSDALLLVGILITLKPLDAAGDGPTCTA